MAFHVVIDPGHGGKDFGATRNEHAEARITLEVARHLKAHLEKDARFQVSLTRQKNVSLSLAERSEIARQLGGQLFISIHVNAHHDPRARGGEIYFQSQLPPDEESMFLANRENQEEHGEGDLGWPLTPIPDEKSLEPEVIHIIKDLQRNYRVRASGEFAKAVAETWRGPKRAQRTSIRQAPFFVISNVNMPSVLVELGFLSNADEARVLTDPAHQRQLAQGLYEGLVRYKETMDKARLKALKSGACEQMADDLKNCAG